MKRILHVTGTFKNDGSTYSTILLHNYLRKQGISSSIAFLSENKSSRIFNINPGIKNRIRTVVDRPDCCTQNSFE